MIILLKKPGYFILLIMLTAVTLVGLASCERSAKIDKNKEQSVLVSHPSQAVHVISIARPVANEVVLCIENQSNEIQEVLRWSVLLPSGDGTVFIPDMVLGGGEKRYFSYKRK